MALKARGGRREKEREAVRRERAYQREMEREEEEELSWNPRITLYAKFGDSITEQD